MLYTAKVAVCSEIRTKHWTRGEHQVEFLNVKLLAPDFFLILAHSVYKMWIIQEQNTLELWNKLHF